jgi:hypothetical protein
MHDNRFFLARRQTRRQQGAEQGQGGPPQIARIQSRFENVLN